MKGMKKNILIISCMLLMIVSGFGTIITAKTEEDSNGAFGGGNNRLCSLSSLTVSEDFGRYHHTYNDSSGTPRLTETNYTFDFDYFPMGIDSPEYYATVLYEPESQSLSEMPICIIIMNGVSGGGAISFKWYKDNGNILLYTYEFIIPSDWVWVWSCSWIGKFPWEINQPGAYHVDFSSPWYDTTVMFTVTSTNTPPVVSDIPNISSSEGEAFSLLFLDGYVQDNEDPDADITWTYSGNSELEIEIYRPYDWGWFARVTKPYRYWTGSETITFTATDTGGLSDSDEATFTSINDKYQLNVSIEPYEGCGEVNLNPYDIFNPRYNYGTEVTLTAIEGLGWIFDHWSGDISGNENPKTIIMNSDKSVIANFILDTDWDEWYPPWNSLVDKGSYHHTDYQPPGCWWEDNGYEVVDENKLNIYVDHSAMVYAWGEVDQDVWYEIDWICPSTDSFRFVFDYHNWGQGNMEGISQYGNMGEIWVDLKIQIITQNDQWDFTKRILYKHGLETLPTGTYYFDTEEEISSSTIDINEGESVNILFMLECVSKNTVLLGYCKQDATVNTVLKSIKMENPPILSDGSVNPSSGNIQTEYTFLVTYSDANNDNPVKKLVYIDNQPHEMIFDHGTVQSGAIYRFTTFLPVGNHQYYFLFNDGYYPDARLPASGNFSGPIVNPDTTPPSPPIISSSTHPNENQWYANNNPSFTWTTPSDPSGIAGYSYLLDQSSLTTPDTIIDTTSNSKSYTNLADGIWWFHVRAKDNAGNWGQADHYRVQIQMFTPHWISPQGYNDPNNAWTSEPNAYDGNTNTKASCSITQLGGRWTPWIELTLPNPTNCNKIRFYAWYDLLHCNKINLDIYNNGWKDVYQGSFADRQWVEKTFTGQSITKVRVSFYVQRLLWLKVVADLHELQIYQIS